MKKLYTIILLTLLSSNLFGQTEYYSTDEKNRLTKSELDKMTAELKETYSKAMSKEMFVDFEVNNTFRSGDSLISNISFAVIDKKIKKEKEKNILYGLIGQQFPNFELVTASNETKSLTNIKGKPTMINFWFTRCAPCIEEMPVLNELATKFADKINFVAITYESSQDVKEFLIKHPFDFSQLVDAKSFTDELGVKSYPTSVFLNSDGIVKKIEGGIAYEMDEDGEMKMGDGKKFEEILESLK